MSIREDRDDSAAPPSGQGPYAGAGPADPGGRSARPPEAAGLPGSGVGEATRSARSLGGESIMDRMINGIEWLAALFVGIVALNIFAAVVLRKFFNTSIPDSYDFGRMLLGILIFWGIAATSYRGGHITVDLVWTAAGPRMKRAIDIFATLVLLFVVAVQTAMLFDKVRGTYVDNVLTYDMNIPTWPFYAVAWLGDVSAVVLIAIRTWRLIFQPELLHDDHPEQKADE